MVFGAPGGLLSSGVAEQSGVRMRVGGWGWHVRRWQAEAPQAPVGSAHAARRPARTEADVCRECRPHFRCDG